MKNQFYKKNFLFKKKSFFYIKQKKSKIFFVIFPKLNDIFLRDPKKKIDKRKSRKVISKNATNQKNMEHTRNDTTQGGKNKRFTTDRGRVPKRQT